MFLMKTNKKKKKNLICEEAIKRRNIAINVWLNNSEKRRLGWAVHAWRKKEALIHMVLCNKSSGKIPLGRLRLRWEYQIRLDVKKLEPDTDW